MLRLRAQHLGRNAGLDVRVIRALPRDLVLHIGRPSEQLLQGERGDVLLLVPRQRRGGGAHEQHGDGGLLNMRHERPGLPHFRYALFQR